MCGIVGYIGYRNADEVIISSLKRLEYRGYDSWGMAISQLKRNGNGIGDKNGEVNERKQEQKCQYESKEIMKGDLGTEQLELQDQLKIHKEIGEIGSVKIENFVIGKSSIGVGHTRWATHGKPSEINAHPHTDCRKKLAIVHNGIIENYMSIKESLEKEGHNFISDTDTEVIAHLIEKNYKEGDTLENAVSKSIGELEGSYAVVALGNRERKLVAARNKSPLILGIGDNEYFVASDVPAVLEYTNRVVYLEDGDLVILTDGGYTISNHGKPVERNIEIVSWSLDDAEKGGYEHFMLKEIHEVPRVVEDTVLGYVSEMIDIDFSFAAGASEIIFTACGTSYHAALVGKYVIEQMSGIPVRLEYASEFNYHQSPMGRALVIGITQSGETADTLEALRKAKGFGARILAITNVLGSSVTRIADHVIYTRAGPEIGVAATKTFIAQLVVIYLIAAKVSMLTRAEMEKFISELRILPEKIRKILDSEDAILEVSKHISGFENIMFIGRALGFPIALEGALKMKEISYIHAEGYPAGELKHGPFALLGEDTPVVACVLKDNTYEVMLSNLKEVKARGSLILAIAEENDEEVKKYTDFVIPTPNVTNIFKPITYSAALQLLAYYTAKLRGCEIDKPRNLAKSVTVE